MAGENLSDFFEFCDIFSIVEAMENNPNCGESFEFQKSCGSPKCKKQKRMSHIAVERNRRKQMNDHISVLRTLMPCLYVKRGDQASIIGAVVNYITELQQLLQSLEAKKQRKNYCDVLSPSTPQPSSMYKPWMQPGYLSSPSLQSPISPCNSSTSSINDAVNELVASSISPIAEVDVKFSGPNLLLKTVSHRIPGQVIKIISALEALELEIQHVKISTVDERMSNCFTIKIGIECQLSAEELVQQIQKTFC